jgi:protein involved in polysaccharide export with SLBB domain
MRIADLVLMADGLAEAHLAEAHLRRKVYDSTADSTHTELTRIQLKKALEDPLGEDNLALRDGDALTIFPRSMFAFPQSVSIFGAVQAGGTFDLADQMRIPELVKMAGGLSKTSYKLEVELVRQHVVKDSVVKREIKRMNMKDILDGKVTIDLQDGDALYVREIIRSRTSMQVTLTGEVKFPGVYEFVEGEKLSSVINRAGGFTEQAYVRGFVLLRESVRQQQLLHATEVSRRLDAQLQGLMQQSTQESDRASISMAMERNRYLLGQIAGAPYLGRVVVKVDKKLKFAGTQWDIPLEGGDQIMVGPNVSTVSVLGEVYSPTTVIYTSSTNTVGEVLSKAGGINLYGDYRTTMYVDPDGTITTARTVPWYGSFRGKSIHPGGTVVVPLKPPAKDYLDAWVKGTQVLYQLAIAVGVAKTLF